MTVNTGPISALDYAKRIPKKQWHNLVIHRSSFCRTNLSADCRDLLCFVDEAKELEMWKELGYSDLNEFIREGLGLDPALVGWALDGLDLLATPKTI